MGTLFLQQLDVQVSLGRPRTTGYVPQPGRGKIEGGLTIRECADHARPPSDLAQDALERIVGANPAPMLLREKLSVSATAASTSSAALVRRKPCNFSITRTAFSRAATMSSLAWIALSMAAISLTLVEGT